jgi:hypothetical protein
MCCHVSGGGLRILFHLFLALEIWCGVELGWDVRRWNGVSYTPL